MTELIRPSLKQVINHLIDAHECDPAKNLKDGVIKNHPTDAHAGLLMQRGLLCWEEGEKPEKQRLVKKITNISPSDLYKHAFERWVSITSDNQRFTHVCARVVGRLYTGLGNAGTLETGLTTHHTYGMPMLAGSSVKGAVRAYAENIGLDKHIIRELFGNDPDDDSDPLSGALVWHDAWWVPEGQYKPFTAEIVTVHHQQYYNQEQIEADEMESPVPNQQIATQGGFYFVIEGQAQWAKFAATLLHQMLQEQGMGSKTASGYGYFMEDEETSRYVTRLIEAANQVHIEREKKKKLETLAEHEKLIAKWEEKLKDKYSVNDAKHTEIYQELIQDLQKAIDHTSYSAADKKLIAEKLSFNQIKKVQANWLSSKREKEIKPLLAKLRGE